MFGHDALEVFFFQAEDGIRDTSVTGVQTCALPISPVRRELLLRPREPGGRADGVVVAHLGHSLRVEEFEIGRASCRERGYIGEVAVSSIHTTVSVLSSVLRAT